MRANTLNRIIIVLTFVGLFIAGTLSMGKAMNAIPPCGAVASGCMQVETDPSSEWGGIPVAYVGFAAYALLAGLAIYRGRKGLGASRLLVNLGYGMSAVGLMISAFLTYYAINEIKATCIWCISSALTMTALFILHAMLAQEELPAEPVGVGGNFKIATASAAVAVIGLIGMGFQLRSSMRLGSVGGNQYKKLPFNEFVPAGAHAQGHKDAVVTVVEFGDLFCPSCRSNYPNVHSAMEQSDGKIQFVFRHLPMHKLPGHEFAFSAAVLSEIAAEQGKFWEYLNAAYSIKEEPKDLQPFIGVLQNLGIKTDNLEQRLTDDKDPAFQRVYDDMKFAETNGVRGTPSYFILRKDKAPEAVTTQELKEWLNTDEATRIVKG